MKRAGEEVADTERIEGARPDDDRIAMMRVESRVEAALFGSAEPAWLGRFVLLKPVAGGGMGEVHRAYDPQLERRVALKLLRPDLNRSVQARESTVTEARVLAQLAHPNVVAVYEVVELDDQIVIVMELVEGQTLAEWEREPHTWRAIVDVYVQAGRGLAAAHDLGIVHRDFKPANAVIGTDGRVRVLDFGLARFIPEATAVDSPIRQQTVTSEIAGTVAFMSPEQLAGKRVTAASDQFSFCVALHRALYGEAPFAGDKSATLAAAIAKGYSPGRKRLPRWLRRVLERGLSVEPAQRFASMTDVIAALTSDHHRRRRRGLIAVAGVVVLAAPLSLVLSRDSAPPACDGGKPDADRAWTANRARGIDDAFARIGTPYAESAKARVQELLVGYRDRWSELHLQTCKHQRDNPASAVVAAQVLHVQQCLDQRLQDLANAADVLATIDASSVTRAVDVAARLPAIAVCGDRDAMNEQPPPPSSGAVAAKVFEIRAQLSKAAALERAGKSRDAIAIADLALTAATGTKHGPIILEAALAKGTFLVGAYDFAAAAVPLADAERLAHEHRQIHAGVLASARRIYAEGMAGRDLEHLVGRAEAVELFSRGLRSGQAARPLLFNYLGVLFMARGDREGARGNFETARELMASIASPDLELVAIEMNLAMLTEAPDVREALAGRAFQHYERQLGRHHLSTLMERCRYARYVRDPVRALELASVANDDYRVFHPTQARDRVLCLQLQATVMSELGRDSSPVLEEISSLSEGSDELKVRGDVARGHLAYKRNPQVARPHFSTAAALDASPNWWEHQIASEGHIGMGLVEEHARALDRARQHYTRAIALLESLASRSEDFEIRARLAFARVALARTLQGVDEPRRAAFCAHAKAFYEAANPIAYRDQIAALE